jgi:OOP family OmpA-OmpF porin
MRLGPKILAATAFIAALLLALVSASLAASVIEDRSTREVRRALVESGHDWAEVDADGLLIHLGGEAPSEAKRFAALSAAGRAVDARRVIDGTTVAPTEPLAPPRFSVEILRNDDGVSLIGLVPAALDRAAMADEIGALAEGAEVTDLLQTADDPVPAGWVPALNFGLDALARLPRAKISIAAGEVAIDAVSGSREEKRTLETLLARLAPDDLRVAISISAPRPVITPFTLRFLSDADGARFYACSADDLRSRDRILAAARAAGLAGKADCRLGLGVPTPEWANAVIQGIEAVDALGGGSVTFSDADVTLVARPETPQDSFDRVVGDLESNLPEVFSLEAVLPDPPDDAPQQAAPAEFAATLSPEGQVQIRGRLPNPLVHDMVESVARARFGVDSVYMAARVTDGLPETWPVRVLAGLAALDELANGAVIVREAHIDLRGRTGNPAARDDIARLLTDKLGGSPDFDLDVVYDEGLDPLADLPSPADCVGKIDAILAGRKITFAPGSTDVEGDAGGVVDRIAEVLRACRKVEMQIEIAGHTDSQGREEMNLDLSQARAEAVRAALADRRVLVSKLTAKGYGESRPIADNDTEEGREANRRIEFRLISPAPENDAAETAAEQAPEAEAGAAADTAETAEAEDTE